MRELGMVPTGGRWGSINRLKDQTKRLFSCTVSATCEDGQKSAFLNQSIASKAVLWWDAKDPEQAGLWQSQVTLSEAFFSEVVSHPIPVDMRALNALKKSPLALDIYCWLTYRASYTKRPSVIPWSALALQFGSDYKLVRQFKAAFLAELRKVLPFGKMQVPLAISVCGNMGPLKKLVTERFWVQDCSAATENLLLAANALGLGAVWCGVHPINRLETYIKTTLNLPETVTPLNIVYVGHPAEEKPARTQFDQAKISHNLFNLPWKLPTDRD